VVNFELLTAFEEAWEGERSAAALEGVWVVEFDVGELAALGVESFAGFGLFFLLFEELTSCDPLFTCCSL
jgi:hypothetical protein